MRRFDNKTAEAGNPVGKDEPTHTRSTPATERRKGIRSLAVWHLNAPSSLRANGPRCRKLNCQSRLPCRGRWPDFDTLLSLAAGARNATGVPHPTPAKPFIRCSSHLAMLCRVIRGGQAPGLWTGPRRQRHNRRGHAIWCCITSALGEGLCVLGG